MHPDLPHRNAGLVGGNALKLGLFGSNCSNGRSYTTVAERWVASWDNNLQLARLADQIGLECMVPIARWKGYGGQTNVNGSSFESIAWACGLLAATQRINVFCTVHVPLIHPIVAAKQMATVDHVGRGRLGVNVVCGWNEDEFHMFGVAKHEHDDRYEQGDEWWSIIRRVWSGESPFDFGGRFYRLGAVQGQPLPYAEGRPMMMNAGSSPRGRTFAIQNSDMHFDGVRSPEASLERIAETKRLAREINVDPSLRLHATDGWVVPVSIVPEAIPLSELICIAMTRRPELAAQQQAIVQTLKTLQAAKMIVFSPTIIAGFSTGAYGGGGTFSDEDLAKIEEAMVAVIKRNTPFRRVVVTRDEARSMFEKMGETFKVELVDAIPDDQSLKIYRQGDWFDLCRGPHMTSTGQVGTAFKLMNAL